MAWWDLLFRRDDAPALPAPVEMHRWDAAAVVNDLTGLGGAADKGASARPNILRIPLGDRELISLYESGGIAHKIVSMIPKEMTRKGWEIRDSTTEPAVMEKIDRDLRIRDRVRQAKTWARLGGTGVALMVTEDDIPTEFRGRPDMWLREPLDLSRVVRLNALQVFDWREAAPFTYETDPNKVNYRNPRLWSLSPVSQGGKLSAGQVVHESRLLWFRGTERIPSERFGRSRGNYSIDDSVLQHMWDAIRNLEQTSAAGAVLAQEIRENVLKIGGMKQMVTGDQKKAIESRIKAMAMMKSLLGIVMLGENDEFQSRVHNPTGYAQLSGEAQAMVSAVSDIPQTILFGHTPAGLSTDNASGRQAFDRKISGEQEMIRPELERVYEVIFASKEGPTEGLIPDSWNLHYLPLDEETETEIAGRRKTIAETDAIYLNWNVLSPKRVEESRFGEAGYQTEILPPLDEGEDVSDVSPEDAAAELEGESVAASDIVLPNGAQVQQAVAIVEKVALGLLPRETGIAMLGELFAIPESRAEKMMGPVGRGFVSAETVRADAAMRIVGEFMRKDADPDPRTKRAAVDKGTAVWVAMFPQSDAAVDRIATLRTQAEEAIGAALVNPPVPHVTLAFVGSMDNPAPAIEAARPAVEGVPGPIMLHGARIEAFPPGPDGRSAVVVALEPWGLESLNARLLRALAPHITAQQFLDFRPHITLGSVEGDVDRGALAEIRLAHEAIAAVDRVTITHGGEIVAQVPLGAG